MRLVDADWLKEWITSHSDLEFEPLEEKEILRLIDDQPTAYDVEKVVAQLEELSKEHEYKVPGNPQTYSEYNEAWGDCCDRAIDIVERGGNR